MEIPIRKRLANGLRVIVCRRPHFRSAEVALYVKAGSMWESADETGISHFMEHLILKGPRRTASSNAFHQELENEGMFTDGLTKEEHVFFSLECHPRDAQNALGRLYEAVADPRFHPRDLETERKVIAEEYYSYTDDNRLDNQLFRLLFPDDEPRFNLIGKLGFLRTVNLPHLRRFYASHFHAGNMVLCLSGNFSLNGIGACLSKTWARLPSGPVRNAPRVQPSGTRKWKYLPKENAKQVEFDMGFYAHSWTDPGYGALCYLSRVTGESACSRLFTSVREESGLAYDISTLLYSLSHCGLFTVRGACSPENFPELLRITERELRRLACDGITREEYLATRKMLTNSIAFSQNSLAATNDFLGLWQLLGNRRRQPVLADQVLRVRDVSPAQIKAMAQQIFRPNNFKIAFQGCMTKEVLAETGKILRTFLAED